MPGSLFIWQKLYNSILQINTCWYNSLPGCQMKLTIICTKLLIAANSSFYGTDNSTQHIIFVAQKLLLPVHTLFYFLLAHDIVAIYIYVAKIKVDATVHDVLIPYTAYD